MELENKAKTNTQRQKEYRERARKELARIDMRINFGTNVKLEDIADFYRVTKKEVLEKLIEWEFKRIMESSEQNDFQEFIKSKMD